MSDSPFYYVRDTGSRVAHHWDYEGDLPDQALCGEPFTGEIVYEGEERPRAVCRACQDLTGPHEIRWWKARAASFEPEMNRLLAHIAALKDQLRRNREQTTAQAREIGRLRKQLKRAQQHATAPKPKRKQRGQSASGHRQPPPIRVVSGGAPGLGKRR